tara:strand:- start:1427 stop:3244 length:1818 start_codon:yes stop_codon:yes gene_type:complete
MSWYGRALPLKWIGPVGCFSVGISFFCTLLILGEMLLLDASERTGHVFPLYQWIVSGSFKLDFAILVDPLSVFMLLVITGVGFVIHVYSIGYMEHDPNIDVFFSYLNLFIFSMSLLVLAADFFFLIVGWAFVGLASYLLIGFWSDRVSAVLAARKAFVMNVIGDVGMVIAAFLIFEHFGTITYVDVFAKAPGVFASNDDGILLITFLLLVGAFAKSAQIPLHTWLPDAMEGPTPVSALIHAATMVTAGVYLVARCHVLYELAPYTMFLVASVGIITAVFAGSMGMVQYDIKRVIAYSTMSQLGYMFLAVGIGVYSVAMFHLMTHAFFKALLFLGAGSVIHGMDEEQDIRKMGGLKQAMPVTFATFLIGSLALSGFPLTSGFFSKEEILVQAWYAEQSNVVFWGMAVIAAGMTGFYSFRLFFYTFLGMLRTSDARPHESPKVMTFPLMVLAFFALFAGFGADRVLHFLAPVFGNTVPEHYGNAILETIGIIVAVTGIMTAGVVYLMGKDRLDFAKQMLAPIYDLMFNRYYIDELYDFFIVRPTRATGKFILERAERLGIDYFVDLIGSWVKSTSYCLSLWQSGNVRTYALNMMVGVFFVLLFVVFI